MDILLILFNVAKTVCIAVGKKLLIIASDTYVFIDGKGLS